MKKKKKTTPKRKPAKRNAGIPANISADDIEKARKLYKAFTWGADPTQVKTVDMKLPKKGEVIVDLGELAAVEYYSSKSGKRERYRHVFPKPDATHRVPRPHLASNADGNQLLIVGGGYKIKDLGIVG